MGDRTEIIIFFFFPLNNDAFPRERELELYSWYLVLWHFKRYVNMRIVCC